MTVLYALSQGQLSLGGQTGVRFRDQGLGLGIRVWGSGIRFMVEDFGVGVCELGWM